MTGMGRHPFGDSHRDVAKRPMSGRTGMASQPYRSRLLARDRCWLQRALRHRMQGHRQHLIHMLCKHEV
jgi:hypothetical protein